jgi:Sec-independent protein translocase protein TatA
MSNAQKTDNQHLRDIIIKNRPLLAKNTINTYMASIRKIQQICDCDAESIEGLIKNRKKIIDSLGEVQTPMVRKSKISVIIAILDDKHNDHTEELAEALKEYRKAMTEDANKVNKREISQELSDKQKDSLISQEEVTKVYNDLKAEATPLLKKQILTRSQFDTLQKYVLLSLYVLIAPRRSLDYASFKIRNFDEKAESSDNYMVNYSKNKKKGTASFIFNTYKNSKRLGRQTVDNIPKPLEKLIDTWKLFNKSDYLLVNGQGRPITQSRIAVLLNDIFGGRNISTSMLRHIYLSDKFKDVNLQDLEETAHDMGQKDIRRTLKYVDKNYDEIVKKNGEEKE